MENVNILHVVQYDFFTFKGGIQRYVKDLAEIQASRGNNVTIYSCSNAGSEKINNVTIKRFKYIELFRTPVSPSLIISALKDRFDIIHIHAQFPITGELVALIAWLRRIPIVITYHNEIELVNMSLIVKLAYKIWSNTLHKLMMNVSNAIIVTTKEFLSTSRISQIYYKKTHIIPIGTFINTDEINTTNKSDISSEYLLYVGRIKPEKGIHLIIKALAKFKRDYKLKLVIIGEAKRDDELDYLNYLRRLCNELDLNDNVIFLGNVSDSQLDYYYANAIALILPSVTRLEGFGIVQLEAMKHGTPIIVSDIPGPRSVSDGVSIKIKPNDVDSLYEAIVNILNVDLRKELRHLSIKKVKEEYDWYKIYNNILRLYNNIIEGKANKKLSIIIAL